MAVVVIHPSFPWSAPAYADDPSGDRGDGGYVTGQVLAVDSALTSNRSTRD
jgi:hypothetical protein